MNMRNWVITVAMGLGFASPATRAPAQDVFSAVGQNAIDIQTDLDAFRADLGPAIAPGPSTGAGPNNRREVNWDGVPDAFSSGGANAFPGDFFNLATGNAAGRIRGIQFTTSGTFEVSADSDSDGDGNPGPVSPLFGNRHPGNADECEPVLWWCMRRRRRGSRRSRDGTNLCSGGRASFDGIGCSRCF